MSTHIDQTISLLSTRLEEAVIDARSALAASEAGRRHETIGTLLPLAHDLKTASSLLDAILVLLRPPQATQPQGDGR